MTAIAKPIRISYREFAVEIEKDLDVLLNEYPNGLYIQHLKEYYGESPNRIFQALNVLQEKEVLKLMQAADTSYYAIKCGVPIKPLIELTDLQRRLSILVMKTCREHNTQSIKTDYGQLTRLLKASPMGLRACLQRLHELGYLIIVEPSRIGYSGRLIVSIGPKLLPTFRDHHFDS